jgi:hypothetical protein
LRSGDVRGLPDNWRIHAMLDNLFTPTHLIIILVIALLDQDDDEMGR